MNNKIYIIAGEPSGDFIGGLIMTNLKSLNSELDFVGIGGCLMQQQGLSSLFPMNEISMMGFFEIIPHIFKLQKLIKNAAADIILKSPDLLITIDSPGFTYRVAEMVRKQKPDLKIMHIVAPSVWAYKPSRTKKYAKLYNHLLTLLPFEPPYFIEAGLNSSYIGHPVLEQNFFSSKKELRSVENIPISSKIICVTAGSRKTEIARHLPIFCDALNIINKIYPDLKVIIVIANDSDEVFARQFLYNADFDFSFSFERLKAFALADIALAKSGTNTLEIAASKTPMVVAYKMNWLSYILLRSVIKVKYASLINIIADREILPELIQFNCNAENISNKLVNLLSKPAFAETQINDSKQILSKLGFASTDRPSIRGTKIILKLLNNEL